MPLFKPAAPVYSKYVVINPNDDELTEERRLVSTDSSITITDNGANSSVSISVSWPVTTKGDLLTYSTVPTRLPVGTDGQILISDSSQTTGLRWGTPGSFTINFVTQSTNEPIQDSTYRVIGGHQIAAADVTSPKFQATAVVTRTGLIGQLLLYNLTDQVIVHQLTDFTSLTPTRIQSGTLTLSGDKTYEVWARLINYSSPIDGFLISWAGLRNS